ncbi:hypothetical protein J8J14_12950 [Roseomonas sp. SSH11]|uniref:Uncharacterized protein n=1 Tax=Pararoseomonas baculiformis TaxID=2820812 RepID=A0ABS4AFA5_9PROT|nr:hypothetical protein [Pararoseomonas baculiformis]MBP0445681.1 hypothetical protein [Pararoseomonas baculiformis]
MRRTTFFAGLALAVLPLLPVTAEARPPWERDYHRWERHERREAIREERWRRERWREARRRDEYERRRYYAGPPPVYVPPQSGVTLQFNLR